MHITFSPYTAINFSFLSSYDHPPSLTRSSKNKNQNMREKNKRYKKKQNIQLNLGITSIGAPKHALPGRQKWIDPVFVFPDSSFPTFLKLLKLHRGLLPYLHQQAVNIIFRLFISLSLSFSSKEGLSFKYMGFSPLIWHQQHASVRWKSRKKSLSPLVF